MTIINIDKKMEILKIIYEEDEHIDRGVLIEKTGMKGNELDDYINELEYEGFIKFLIGSKSYKTHTDSGEWKHVRITDAGINELQT